MSEQLLSVDVIDGCPICDVGDSVEQRRYDMGNMVQATLKCLACGWHDMSILSR